MKYIIPIISLLLVLSCVTNRRNGNPSSNSNISKNYYFEEPTSFILNEFNTHEVVFLGEPHMVKEHLLFLQRLLPQLHQNGINILFFEFANYDDTARINQLLTNPTFSEKLAKDIIHSQYWEWDFQEYVDVFRVVWNINRNSKAGNKFRVIGLNSSDWSEHRMSNWTEEDWAKCIYKEAVTQNKKALVYCGAHHALTKYQQPYAENGKFMGFARKDRAGHYLYKMIGEKCVTIWFHFLWPDFNYKSELLPFQGWIDSLIKSMPISKQQFAINTKTSPLGELMDSTALYSMRYDPVQLKDIVDGYIVLGPLSNMHMVEQTPAFVTAANIEQTNKQVAFFYKWKNLTVNEANDTLNKWYIQSNFSFYNNIKLSMSH